MQILTSYMINFYIFANKNLIMARVKNESKNGDIEKKVMPFSKENYMPRKNEVVKVLLKEDFTITERRYVGYEEDTGFHHFAIDVSKIYKVRH